LLQSYFAAVCGVLIAFGGKCCTVIDIHWLTVDKNLLFISVIIIFRVGFFLPN
jgi:hypothetical protein